MSESVNLDNTAIADALERYALLLDLSGALSYAVRAYRRAAELVRALPTPVADLVPPGACASSAGSAGESRRASTSSCDRRDRARAGARRRGRAGARRPRALPRAPPKRAVGSGARSTRAPPPIAGGGRERTHPGRARHGAEERGELRDALDRAAEPRAPRGLLLNQARELADGLAAALDGVAAGDPRRWADVSTRFAVVSSSPACSTDSRHCRRSSRSSSAPSPRATGVTGSRASRSSSSSPKPARFWHRAPPRDRHAGVRRRAARCPMRRTRSRCSRRSACWAPSHRSSASARIPGRRRTSSSSSRSAATCTCTRRGRDGRASVLEMGEAARGRGYEYVAICDHTRNVRVVPGLDADDVRRQSQGEEIAEANRPARTVSAACCGDRVRHLRTERLTFPTTCSPSSTGAGERARRPARRATR